MTSDRPPWDEARARSMIGKNVLIGLTRVSRDGENHEQMFGVIESADAARGFKLGGLLDGETYWLPPHTDAFRAADAGEYRLKSTGEIVIDPDYLATWTIKSGTTPATTPR